MTLSNATFEHIHVQPQNLLRAENAGFHLSVEGRNKNKQERSCLLQKSSSYFYSLLKVFQFLCLQESTSEKSLCHRSDLVKLHLYVWSENLKKEAKTFYKKARIMNYLSNNIHQVM